ncbi:hypothetical protein AGABI1DRAFT_111415 [Agaricus bisporus var. burnettii JB137-S8]|uniref:Calcineurin-like phosphoesterase domain-containing protein n=1 Tax=Agaricus bisporus var. burnettii (strain JB137-S8 / ATCC MYA-4627 / FGSC 10392) TaxID=597362 RepID=K5W7M0_AGABU|nr:uncharacterized protein AGABI1DRAFT_111415 [Agaricus bisporus var. burnettii JB137-S8]EKM82849.1 hypothetical protein AGABI1DRAFT_111415 [Agaricus bisporus var. burnettii JB137-S8]
MSSWGYPEQVMKVLKWIANLDYPVKIIIGGNHDLCLDKDDDLSGFHRMDVQKLAAIQNYIKGEEMKKANVHYLEYESIEFTTAVGRVWRVYGSPAAPKYATGAFQYEGREEAQAIYAKIPSNAEIVITHTPAKYCLDVTMRGKNAGCRVLRKRLDELKECRLHVFGHIHECAGVEMVEGGRVGANAAMARTGAATVVDLLN